MRFSPTQQRRVTLNRCLQRSNVLFHIGCTTHKNNSWLYLNLNCIPNFLILIQYLTKPTGRPDDHLQEAGPSGVWMIICKRQQQQQPGRRGGSPGWLGWPGVTGEKEEEKLQEPLVISANLGSIVRIQAYLHFASYSRRSQPAWAGLNQQSGVQARAWN